MGRISEQEISQIKAEVSLERLVEASGIALKRHGKDLLGRCPLHDDKTPSLVVTPEKNLWHCLGACQTGGSVIDWVMKTEKVSFRHAVELLREKYLPSLVAKAAVSLAPSVSSQVVELDTCMSDQALLERVVAYYQRTLKQSPEALEYLEKRGLSDPALIDQFRLGFANRTLAYKLPPKSQKAGAALKEQLIRIGVLRDSGHEHLNGSLIIPILSSTGEILGMYGRKVTRKLRKGTPLHLYLPGPHRGVWNSKGLEGAGELILCESLIDACTFWSAGFRNVTCAYGIEGVTEEVRIAILEHPSKRLLIAYDRDEAGDKAAAKLAAELGPEGVACYRVKFPRGMDANEFALKVTPASESLGLAIRQAEWMGVGGAEARKAPMPPAQPKEAAKKSDVVCDEKAHPEPATHPFLVAAEAAPEGISESQAVVAPPANPAPPTAEAPAPQPSALSWSANGTEATCVWGDRHWRVRGIPASPTPGSLKVNLLVRREGAGFFVDTLEMYSARHRQAFAKEGAAELGVEENVLKHDLGQVLLGMEQLLDERQQAEQAAETKVPQLSEGERASALDFLKSPDLLDRLLEDFEKLGVVGEATNKLIGYLAATSRKLEEPLAVVIQSSSAAGKSSLMDAILKLLPKEERLEFSAMTGQSLFYMGENDLRHKVLAIVEEEGAERASYALKLLQSEGELTIASTGKDPATGRLVTEEYRVTGPVTIFLTTTAVDIDEELLNRCLVLTVDEGREQTRAIHERQRQRRTLEGMVERHEEKQLLKLHQNAQRLLEPLHVVNPHAEHLTFPDHQTRLRRDHKKYLGLIEAIAFLHQHQRPIQELKRGGETLKYIEVTWKDIELANRLAREVLGRSLDELPPQTRRLLGLLDELVQKECKRQGISRSDFRFSRKEARDFSSWGDTQLRVHLGRLIELEYLLVHRGRQGQSYEYELLYAGEVGAGPYLPGLIETSLAMGSSNEARTTTETSRGRDSHLAGGVRGSCGPDAGGVRPVQQTPEPHQNGSHLASIKSDAQTSHPGPRLNGTSYPKSPIDNTSEQPSTSRQAPL